MIDTLMPAVLTDRERAAFARMKGQLEAKRAKNKLLSVYYDGAVALKALGIAIPPKMAGTSAALGWPGKAVQALAQKHVFEGFSLDGDADPFGIVELLDRNRFGMDLPQGITSAYKHSCSFVTVTAGDTAAGDPEAVVQVRDAETTTALWDNRRREITALLAVTATDELGDASGLVLMFPGKVITANREMGRWVADARSAPAGRIMAEMLVHDPQLGRPFGRSRITREVRYLTDAAVRTLVRAEVSAEFFSAPQRYALGLDKDAFTDAQWTAYMGRLLALEVNEQGEKPDVGQFPQISMEPHLSMYRQLAQNFCAATSLPQSSVGIYADNPSSAEAMQAAEAQLAETAEYQWRVFKPALVRTAQNIIMVRDRLEEPPAESWRLRVNTRPARYVSPQAAADFTSKAVSAIPKIGETTQALRGLGYSDEEIEGMRAEWSRQGAVSVLDRIMPQAVPDA